MILVFGGTTEGRKAVEVLEEGGSRTTGESLEGGTQGMTYYYSTKTGEQEVTLHNGLRIDGAMDGEALRSFCTEHGIRLIVDAAHPFAARLHQTIASVAEALAIPVIRYERIYPPRDPDIVWIDDYSEIPRDIHSLLATTGVQSIAKLKPLEDEGIRIWYRILNRESSIAFARQQGASDAQLCYYDDPSEIPAEADAILLKESGLTGGFLEKVKAAKERGMRIIALKRPKTPNTMIPVNGPYGLRRAVEKFLPEFFPLHSGLTTGTCATAAAVAATLQLLRNNPQLILLGNVAQPLPSPQGAGWPRSTSGRLLPKERKKAGVGSETSLPSDALPPEVPVILPNGETILVPVSYHSTTNPINTGIPPTAGAAPIPHSPTWEGSGCASCVKESGDDPDVTNGLEIRATVQLIIGEEGESLTIDTSDSDEQQQQIEILGGEGVGRFTLPGFDFPPGSPAINKAPREMIRQNIMAVLNPTPSPPIPHLSFIIYHLGRRPPTSQLAVTISVPGGEEIARRTFNPRLGIEGGISIIGVSGIVKPFSEEAFINSIRKCVEVAIASGTDRIVINSGAKSERFLKELYPTLPPQAFVQYGNYIGETLKIIASLSPLTPHPSPLISNSSPLSVTLGVMLGKAVKLAQGHLDTHSRKATMDCDFIRQLLDEAGISIDIGNITLARELWDKIPPEHIDKFVNIVIAHCEEHCKPILSGGNLTILLIDDDGHIYGGK